ncbi:hypothetical protein [Pseudactinotalea sp. Z1748]|uniref:hypothetical protein n=1 Tax=Pseudactinotalea sp. Z1748 TaxID=3413027 RepID=UPI003C7A1A02
MPAQNLPAPYAAYVREQRRMARGAVAEVRRQWRRTGDDFDASWESVGTAILTTTGATQHQVAELAGEFIPDYMDQAFTRPPPAPVGRVNPNSLVGVAGDGRTAEGLMYGAVTRTKSAVGSGLTPQQARAAGLAWITMATTTLLADTIRAGEVVGGATRGGISFVRAIQPGACARCAILAGRTYSSRQAFERHPGCLCTHLPVSPDMSDLAAKAEGYAVSPEEYFEELSKAEQERIFTKAGAEAIRAGADPTQVVNARRGMSKAQPGHLRTTTEGATRSGIYGRRSGGTPRLMPESIVEIADGNVDRMQDLLRQYGYIWR